jgi:hypothetical protein
MPYIHAQDGTRLFYSAWGAGESVLFIQGGNVGSASGSFRFPQLSPRALNASPTTSAASTAPTSLRRITASTRSPAISTRSSGISTDPISRS